MRTIPTDGTTAYVGDGVNDIESSDGGCRCCDGRCAARRDRGCGECAHSDEQSERLTDAMRSSCRVHTDRHAEYDVVLPIKLVLAVLALSACAHVEALS